MEDGESIIQGDYSFADGRRVTLFSSEKSLRDLARAANICGDCTFRITPKPWKQTMIMSAATTDDVWVSSVFGLLPDKQADTYEIFYSLLRNALTKYGLELSAEHFMSDFEDNLRNKFKEYFPKTKLIGCHFHFAKGKKLYSLL